jgi:hypothetical protein
LAEAEKSAKLLWPSGGAGLLTTKPRPRRGRLQGKWGKSLIPKHLDHRKGRAEIFSMSEKWRLDWQEALAEGKKPTYLFILEFKTGYVITLPS